ncbi:MAG: hypothetical protein WC497_05145 [Patescibacteria group bacterium]
MVAGYLAGANHTVSKEEVLMRRFWCLFLLVLLLASVTVASAQPIYFQRTYPVTLTESASLAQLIEAGAYDRVNPDVTNENFRPVMTAGTFEIVLKQYGRPLKTGELRKRLDKDGLIPVTLPQLLAFGAAYPEVQRHYHIACLGTVWVQRSLYKDRESNKEVERQDAPNQIVFLRGSSTERSVNTCLEDNIWVENACFACIKKP